MEYPAKIAHGPLPSTCFFSLSMTRATRNTATAKPILANIHGLVSEKRTRHLLCSQGAWAESFIPARPPSRNCAPEEAAPKEVNNRPLSEAMKSPLNKEVVTRFE